MTGEGEGVLMPLVSWCNARVSFMSLERVDGPSVLFSDILGVVKFNYMYL